MKKFSLFCLFVFLSTSAFSQYSVGDFYQSYTDASRSRNVPIHIYYPATSTGTNAPAAVGTFPVIAFGHGFIISYTQYEWLVDALVPLGYIVAFPDTETGIPPDHHDFGLDIAFTVNAVISSGSDPASVINGIVGNTSALSGHSMGGGASFLGADGNSNISALFAFAAAETNPSAISAAANISVPALIIEGSDDCVTPSVGNSLDMYNSLSSSCKSLYSINGGSHCKFANSDFICGFGELGCGGSISLAAQEAFSLDLLIPFLDLHLNENCDAGGTLEALVLSPAPNSIQSICSYSSPPTLSIAGLPSTSSDLNPIQLSAMPSGGVFSGNGMVGNTFNPGISGTGIHDITYTVNANGCENELVETIFVFNVAYNFATYSLGTISP